jgi:hypothetical protein
VMSRVLLSWPHVMPQTAFKRFSRCEHFAAMATMCCLKVNWGSKVTPRILGYWLIGMSMPFMETLRLVLYCLLQGVKSVT